MQSKIVSFLSSIFLIICPRSLDPFYIVTNNINREKTSWTYSTPYSFPNSEPFLGNKNRSGSCPDNFSDPDTDLYSDSCTDTLRVKLPESGLLCPGPLTFVKGLKAYPDSTLTIFRIQIQAHTLMCTRIHGYIAERNSQLLLTHTP